VNIRSERGLAQAVIGTLCLFLLTAGALAIEAQIDLKLSIPECKLLLYAGDRVDLPQSEISHIILQVRPKVGAVRYGSIRVMLNGESLNRDMTVNGVDGGYDCVIEGAKGSSLPLRPHDNSIQVILTDTWNHAHEASYTITVPAKASS